MSGPLHDLRVLDLSRVLAGPSCTQVLGDLGADVIKIEHPQSGDMTRGWSSSAGVGEGARADSAYFWSANRNKRSVAVDFGTREGAALIRRLAQQSVLVENYACGTLSRYGLGYGELRESCPGLIYCSITAFGQSGPRRDELGYDLIIQAMSGLMSITGEPDGEPMRAGVAIADITAGLYAAVGILAALVHRSHSQRGQHLDIALWEAQVASLSNVATSFLADGRPPARHGTGHPTIVPYQQFATLDGHIVLAVGNDEQFTRFCEAAGSPELAADARFQTNAERVKHRAELVPRVAALLARRTSGDWVAALRRAAVPVGPIYTLPEVFSDGQAHARKLTTTLRHASGVDISLLASPLRFSRTPVSYRLAPPGLGEQTDEVLAELGATSSEIAEWRRSGVIG
jgi:crotonobetainyl-CoA:carnitine CoA-transferase CaiB-like acyl-CoA transferase